jgi:hypothetical protein
MYKNVYNPKSKITSFFLFFIATILAEIQGEIKRKQEVKRREDKKKWSNLSCYFILKMPFLGIY